MRTFSWNGLLMLVLAWGVVYSLPLHAEEDYEEEEEKDRHEYLRSQCKDHIKMDLYNNKEKIDDENPRV